MENRSTFGSAPPGKANASRRLEEGLGMARTSDVTKIAKCVPDPAPSSHVVVLPLKWDGNEARSPVGNYRVQRLDDKWEPLHDGYYMLPRLHGMVKAFDTFDQAKEHAEEQYRMRILSTIETQPPQTNGGTDV